jgi:hypothetical protein
MELVKDVEARATLAGREVQERVSRIEAKGTTTLSSTHGGHIISLRELPFLRASL